MILISSLVMLTLARQCSCVAKLLEYRNDFNADVSGDFVSVSNVPSIRTVKKTGIPAIPFFGGTCNQITIFESGVVILEPNPTPPPPAPAPAPAPLSSCPSSVFSTLESGNHYIAAYWRRATVNFGGKGRIFFQAKKYDGGKQPDYLEQLIQKDIATAFPDDGFVPSDLVIVTWHQMGSFNEASVTLRNTFQLVIAYNKTHAYAVFLFGNMQYFSEQDQANYPCTEPAKVGVRSGTTSYWINYEVERFEQAKRIQAHSNIKQYDRKFFGRYCLRLFGETTTKNGKPLLFPMPAPALHQNCSNETKEEVCAENVPDNYCVGNVGTIRHPNLCSKFVFCNFDKVQGIGSCPPRGSNNSCPEGMTWNTNNRACTCDNPQNCQTSGFSDFAFAPGATATTAFTPPNIFEKLDCEYYPDGNYIDFDDCTRYIACSNTRSIRMACPAGLKWNPKGVNGGYGGFCDYSTDCSREIFKNPTTTAAPTTVRSG